MKKDEIYLSFRFTGDNEIGIDEFSKFLNNVSGYLTSIKDDLKDNNIKLNTTVTAIEKGSFVVHILPEISVLASLLTPSVENTSTFIELARKIISIIEFLKGRPPKEITSKTIINYNGDQININAPIHIVFNKGNSETFKAVEKLVVDIPKDRELEIYDSVTKEKVTINDKNKSYFSKIQNEVDEDTLINTSEKQTVIVRKPSLDMSSKWTIYTDKSIQVEIKDEQFAKLVKDGKIAFSNNFKLVVDIQTTSFPNDEKMKPIYVVTKVYLDRLVNEQQKLDI